MAVAATHQQRQIDVVTRERINNVLTVLMAGRASEEILLGAPSAGAGGDHESDLARASNVASQAVTNWGLGGGSSAPRWRGIRHGTDHFPVPLPQHVDTEIDTMLAKAYAAAVEIICTHRDAVEALAERLRDAGELDGATVHELLRRHGAGSDTRPSRQ